MLYKIKLQYEREPWDDTGRTVYVDAATPSQARSFAKDVIAKPWTVCGVEPVTGE